MSSTLTTSPAPAQRLPAYIPDWVSLFAGVAMMALLGLVIDPGDHPIEPQTFGVIAALGYLLGFLLAELRLPDLLAHFIGFVSGVVASTIAVAPSQTWGELRSGAMRDFARRNWGYAETLATAIRSGDRLPDDVAVMGIALTLWLVGYVSAWMLFRRGWFVWSVALPATVLLTSLALDRDQPAWPAIGFTGFAIAQGFAATSRARSGSWLQRGIPGPRNGHRWATIGGALMAAIVILASANAALTIPQETQDWVVAQSQRAAESISSQIDRITEGDPSNFVAGNYGEFSDEFKIGEGVASGDTPVARLRSPERSYLTARRFDYYDGSGWSTTLGELPVADGTQPFTDPPKIAFRAGQAMNLPQSVVEHSTEVSGEITLYTSNQDLLFTLDTHQSVSVGSSVRVGWQSIETRIVVDQAEISAVPLDLRALVGLLRLATFAEDELSAGVVSAIDPTMQRAIEDERESLLKYPVQTTIEYSTDEGVVLFASGRLPVYTDIEAVFSAVGQQLGTYSAVGLSPSVDEASLIEASDAYPAYITNTYLQLSESVTPRTRTLAQEVVSSAGATNSYAMAKAVESYLRANYQYLLESSLAPEGEDIVDYFLFEHQIGRCDHFASSMVVLLRSLGIPSRIVTGLAPVPFDNDAGGFLYRTRDAHAWVEVYFPGFGWIPFEPTPNQGLIDLNDEATSQQGPIQPTPQTEPPTPEAEATTEPDPAATPIPTAAEPPGQQGGGLQSLRSFPGFLIPVVLALASFAGLLALLWRWPLRKLTPGASYFFRLQRVGSLYGLRSDSSMTPGEYAVQYNAVSPRYTEAASTIADAYTDERYGPPELSESVSDRGIAGWRELRTAALRWRPWKRRRT